MTDNPTRRDALKALAAATGALTIASLPSRWARPALHVGAIPAHAQASCIDLIIEFTGGNRAVFTNLPTPDEGNPNPASGEDGTWVWYCGLDSRCFLLGGGDNVASSVIYRLTSRDGTVLFPESYVALTSGSYYFDATTGTVYAGCGV